MPLCYLPTEPKQKGKQTFELVNYTPAQITLLTSLSPQGITWRSLVDQHTSSTHTTYRTAPDTVSIAAPTCRLHVRENTYTQTHSDDDRAQKSQRCGCIILYCIVGDENTHAQ